MTAYERLRNIRIVLCEPAHPGNIGAAARALKTMGLERLVLVQPKSFPHPDAQAMYQIILILKNFVPFCCFFHLIEKINPSQKWKKGVKKGVPVIPGCAILALLLFPLRKRRQ